MSRKRPLNDADQRNVQKRRKMSSAFPESNKDETLRGRAIDDSNKDLENGTGSPDRKEKLQPITARIAERKNISDDQKTKTADASGKRNVSNSNRNAVQPSAPKCFEWQWIDNDGTWHDYDSGTQLLMENLSIGNKFTIRAGKDRWTYDITKLSADLCRFCAYPIYPTIHCVYLNFNEI